MAEWEWTVYELFYDSGRQCLFEDPGCGGPLLVIAVGFFDGAAFVLASAVKIFEGSSVGSLAPVRRDRGLVICVGPLVRQPIRPNRKVLSW